MNNLSTSVLKQLSINNKEYLFFKKTCPRNLARVYKPYQICIYCWQESFKMAEHITKSCHKLFFFTRTSISRNDNFPFFSCSKEKDMFG